MVENIKFPRRATFYDTYSFENVIRFTHFSESRDISRVRITIGRDCRFMADATLKLLCLCHHILSLGKGLELNFEGGECRCYTFLERCGFFRVLSPHATVLPTRPSLTSDASLIYAGQSNNLLEIKEVSPTHPASNRPIPGQLTDALGRIIKTDCERFLTSIQTVVSEFCSNVPEHSQTTTPGFVYMHHYPRTEKIVVSVADIGVGLLNSLRQGLVDLDHHLQDATDQKLILEMFNTGLSRKGERRGSGLNRAAEIAIEYDGRLHVRLDRHVIDLRPEGSKFAATAFWDTDCALAKGTHISFTFSSSNL